MTIDNTQTARDPLLWLRGDRVALGPFTRDLVEDYWRWEQDPQVIIGYGRQTPESLEARIAGYESQARSMANQTRFTVYDLTADSKPRPVGTTVLRIDHHVRSAEYVILLGAEGDIDALWEMCATFTDVDQRLGGGYARSTLLHYVNQVVLPLLQGSYDDAIGRELMAATARLCDLCGYMSWDSGRQGLAQRYFIQALRLAQASGNRALGAHILVDMATQAHSLGDATQALDLASAGLDCGSPVTEARCASWQGRAHAFRGDQRACAQACSIAERALDRAAPAGERVWFKVFTPEAMNHEMLHMASDLGRHDDVQRLAPEVLASAGGMARRRVLGTTALASSYLPSPGNPHSDIDRACALLGQVIPLLGSLSSTHSLERVNSVRRALAAHAGRPSVQEVEDRFRSTIAAVGARR